MPFADALLILVAFALTFAVIGVPLSRGHLERATRADETRIADLEAAKQARYREIREAEMDFRTGKLSEADWRAIDRELRAEAMQILRQLDKLGVGAPAEEQEEAAGAPPADEPSDEPVASRLPA